MRLRTAARIADRFDLDPVVVFGERDLANWMVRSAAYQVIQQDEEKARKDAENKRKK